MSGDKTCEDGLLRRNGSLPIFGWSHSACFFQDVVQEPTNFHHRGPRDPRLNVGDAWGVRPNARKGSSSVDGRTWSAVFGGTGILESRAGALEQMHAVGIEGQSQLVARFHE